MSSIITTDKDNNTGRVSCKSNLSVNFGAWGDYDRPMNYTVERTSDGETFVTLLGI